MYYDVHKQNKTKKTEFNRDIKVSKADGVWGREIEMGNCLLCSQASNSLN